MHEEYDPNVIEPKWQKRWLDENLFAAAEVSPKRKMYVLDMFPYPSGDGLHVGHVKVYTASDIIARFLRMRGFNVLHPTGWDAFGLPTENSAIKFGVHPAELTKKNINRFRQQMQRLGFSYDWDREINTSDPAYYKWTQWIFLRLYKMGLAYEATIPIHWCPKDKTGLANEEVVDGRCERCGTPVEQRPMRQWLLRITKYAQRLLDGLDGLGWPEFIRQLQRNWIGLSEGIEITFDVESSSKTLPVFTTRPDTIFGATYVVLSPDHPLVDELAVDARKDAVQQYRNEAAARMRMREEEKEKIGVFSGSYAVNPANGARIPIWIADYVLMSYGTGAIMAVPAHDERDFEFATKNQLPVLQVIQPKDAAESDTLPYTGPGVLINSGQFDGQDSEQAQESIFGYLRLRGMAKKAIHTKLRDWVFSRQRYWGEPIPIIHCERCGTVPVPEKDLPVVLPQVERYEPTGTGESPLAAIEEWVNVKCPTCPGMGKRETNTMPQWAGSSWYWLRYLDPRNKEALASKQAIGKWMPVDVYIGGAEHAVLHLLYARFWSKVLYDIGVVSQEEPFSHLRNVGLVMGEDGQKMSKSRGNVINPDAVVDQFGADVVRLYEMFMGPFEASAAWDTNSIKGIDRFVKRVRTTVSAFAESGSTVDDEHVILALHQTIRRVTQSTENFRFNTAISSFMEFLRVLEREKKASTRLLETFVLLLSPYAPHLAEELWEHLGHGQSLMYQPWPQADERILASAQVTVPIQVNGKLRGTLSMDPGANQAYVEAEARKLPNVAKHLALGTVTKVIFVQDKLLNFVVRR